MKPDPLKPNPMKQKPTKQKPTRQEHGGERRAPAWQVRDIARPW